MKSILKDTKKSNRGGKREGAGRKRLGDNTGEELRSITIAVEQSVIDKCREYHGTLAQALRFSIK